ncbi:TetR/AcrR family transcriptional regulator [Nocardia sp. NEAU-G5]|uniref:TetR/AcrR family transcriptional regulator n=1 Tax=Nocardia albiluteola TaxID=2842303 RepID=A0ABS6BAJ1_9NOCA|nr:TetR/AcrR family transcriptional regulator [Nocardia albiluteola]MBU3067299.1 TetR/AcrR family transcriptional regulator [Nocardia albiluteola]
MPEGLSTRQLLSATALRMFAERGIDAVSMRELTAAAGQRNKSAAQYHYGSKEQLVREIFEQHTGAVNQRRWELLGDLGYDTRKLSVPELAEALILPLAELAQPPAGHYLRFLAQVSTPPWVYALTQADPGVTSSIQYVLSTLATRLDRISQQIVRTRLSLSMVLAVQALAGFEHAAPRDDPADRTRARLFSANLVDATVGILTAPVSENAAQLLPQLRGTPTDPGWLWPTLIDAASGN